MQYGFDWVVDGGVVGVGVGVVVLAAVVVDIFAAPRKWWRVERRGRAMGRRKESDIDIEIAIALFFDLETYFDGFPPTLL